MICVFTYNVKDTAADLVDDIVYLGLGMSSGLVRMFERDGVIDNKLIDTIYALSAVATWYYMHTSDVLATETNDTNKINNESIENYLQIKGFDKGGFMQRECI